MKRPSSSIAPNVPVLLIGIGIRPRLDDSVVRARFGF